MSAAASARTHPTLMPSEHDEFRFAAQEGIRTLYKFRPYSTDEDRRRVHEILIDHKVYFARASQLNDKRDLRPQLRFRGSTEAETRQILLADAEQVWARRPPPYSGHELQNLRERLATRSLEQLEQEALLRTHERLEDHYWILSLAASRDYVPMWDDYADRRRGLCIHFRSDGDSPFGLAQRVLYQREVPVLLVPLGTEREVADRCTLTKTLRWQQEREYRLVRYPDVDFSDAHLRFDGQHAHFLTWAISGITVGPNMPVDDVRDLLKFADAHDPPLPIWRPNAVVKDVGPG